MNLQSVKNCRKLVMTEHPKSATNTARVLKIISSRANLLNSRGEIKSYGGIKNPCLTNYLHNYHNMKQNKHIRNSFVFYSEFLKAIRTLEDKKQQLSVFQSISHYALDFIEPSLIGDADKVWQQIKPILDRDIKKWQKRHLF